MVQNNNLRVRLVNRRPVPLSMVEPGVNLIKISHEEVEETPTRVWDFASKKF